MKRLLTCGCLFWAMCVWAQPVLQKISDELPERISAERERLKREREGVEQANSERMRECWQRFAVNDCLRQVRRSRYTALDPIRDQELELNQQERVWRTQQRDERLQEKSSKVRSSEPASGAARQP